MSFERSDLSAAIDTSNKNPQTDWRVHICRTFQLGTSEAPEGSPFHQLQSGALVDDLGRGGREFVPSWVVDAVIPNVWTPTAGEYARLKAKYGWNDPTAERARAKIVLAMEEGQLAIRRRIEARCFPRDRASDAVGSQRC